jgi:hypothetical protein
MKFYTVVIHNLQMCMKEYGCCPKFGRGDNLTYTLKYVLVVYYNCVKFHKNPISCLGGVALTRYMPSFFL